MRNPLSVANAPSLADPHTPDMQPVSYFCSCPLFSSRISAIRAALNQINIRRTHDIK